MDEFINRRCVKAAFANAVGYAASELRRRRQALGFDEAALFGVESDEIREGAANINRDDDHALSTAAERFRGSVWWDHRATTPVSRCQAWAAPGIVALRPKRSAAQAGFLFALRYAPRGVQFFTGNQHANGKRL